MKTLFFLLIPLFTFSQVTFPNAPQPTQMQHYGNQNFGTPSTVQPPNPMNIFYGTDEQKKKFNNKTNKSFKKLNETKNKNWKPKTN